MEKDFFISYNRADQTWAEWIAWQLEAAGYSTVIQSWDFGPGTNFALRMHEASAQAVRTIAVLSPDYLTSGFAASEWSEAFADDPTGEQALLVPVRVRRCEPDGLLGQVVYVDLVGLDPETARETLLTSVRRGRAKPSQEPEFPDHPRSLISERPRFPGSDAPDTASPLSERAGQGAERADASDALGIAHNVASLGKQPSTHVLSRSQPFGKRYRLALRSLWNSLSVLGKAFTAIGGVGGLAAFVTAVYQLGLFPLSPGPDASVSLSNAVLRQIQSTEQGDVLDIAYDITLTNMEGDSVTVTALALEADSREPTRSSQEPGKQIVTAETADDSGQGSIIVPFPLAAGCLVVRVEALETDGDRIDDTETRPFDPFDLANPACPSSSMSTNEEEPA